MLLVLIAAALAQGLSVDSQLLHPVLGEGAVAGVEAPPLGGRGLMWGGAFSLEVAPVRTHVAGMNVSMPVLSSRLFLAPTLGYQWGRGRVSADIGGALNAGRPPLARTGMALGDPGFGLTRTMLTLGTASLGLNGTLRLPLGSPRSWLSEDFARLETSLLLHLPRERFTLGAEAGLHLRRDRQSLHYYETRDEVVLRGGLRVPVSERLTVGSSLLYEFSPKASGWEEQSLELLVGLSLDGGAQLGLGRGLSQGLGTTSGRLWAQSSRFVGGRERDKEEEVEVAAAEDQPEPLTGLGAVHLPATQVSLRELSDLPPAVSRNGLAEVVEDRIVIAEPIHFQVGTAVILERSLPVLEAVAELITDHPEIVHVAIVGHASAEGEHRANYTLSTQRARSLYEQLLINGVHPHRLSYRGMGEVEPQSDELADNRRVEFHIVRQLDPLDIAPELSTSAPLPWSGEEVQIKQPPPPALPEPEPQPYERLDAQIFDEDSE